MDVGAQIPAREEVQFTFVVDLLERVATRLEPLSTALDDEAFNELVRDVVKFKLRWWQQEHARYRDGLSNARRSARVRPERVGAIHQLD